MAKLFNIKTATTYWIKPIEKTTLELVFTNMTQAKAKS